VATGLTGAWVRTIQGLVFLISIIFYLWVEEPHRLGAFFARNTAIKLKKEFDRTGPAG
jgi:simple sugar transport system permease protein